MKASELRIGNWLNCECLDFENECIKLENIHPKGTTVDGYPYSFKELKPIPLTEEWLLKFGFKKNENGLFKLFNESEVPILLNEDLNGWTCDGINFSVNGTQYVHQLQNLYFALTGEELTIKLIQ